LTNSGAEKTLAENTKPPPPKNVKDIEACFVFFRNDFPSKRLKAVFWIASMRSGRNFDKKYGKEKGESSRVEALQQLPSAEFGLSSIVGYEFVRRCLTQSALAFRGFVLRDFHKFRDVSSGTKKQKQNPLSDPTIRRIKIFRQIEQVFEPYRMMFKLNWGGGGGSSSHYSASARKEKQSSTKIFPGGGAVSYSRIFVFAEGLRT
jgi:hypothetical protein